MTPSGAKPPALKVLRGTLGEPTDGSREVLRELYEKYGPTVFHRCSFLLRDPTQAEDAMQDVFAKAIASYAGFRAEASPLTWLIKISTHHCLNLLRSRRAPWRDRFQREEQAKSSATNGPQVFEMRDMVLKMLSRVDEETQAAAIHYYVDEMSLEEVATLLDRSAPTIRKRLHDFSTLCEREFQP